MNVHNKRIIIIGAGIAGLSTGCYLQMNDYDTEIFEAHNKPGGLCTAWQRKGYVIEGCIHGLVGSSPSNPYYKLWNEVIDMKNLKFIDQEVKHLIDFGNGKQFIQYANLEKLEYYMKKISPEDKGTIEDFVRETRRIQKIAIPVEKPREFFNIIDMLKMLRAIPLLFSMKKWLKTSSEDFAKSFKNHFLREATKYFLSPILFEMLVLSEMDLKRSGYPSVGSLEFSKLIEKKYLSLGGKINYRSKVKKILVENNKATGIQIEDGSNYRADIIVSAADGRSIIFNMLEGKYTNKTIEQNFKNADLNPSRIQISLGIDRIIKEYPRSVKLILTPELMTNDGNKYKSIDLIIYNDTDELSPPGKTLIVVQLETSNDKYWTDLRKSDIKKYREEKDIIATEIINILDERIGQIKENIEMIDIATPATYIRYTGNWRGSIQGWANENIFKSNPFKKQLPGLSNFYLTGQWVEPGGGVPTAFKSGRDLAQIICKKDKKRFETI
jgi:phytoene dehydrogenase-like protein